MTNKSTVCILANSIGKKVMKRISNFLETDRELPGGERRMRKGNEYISELRTEMISGRKIVCRIARVGCDGLASVNVLE